MESSHPPWRRPVAGAAVALTILIGACGSNDRATQPAPGVTSFTGGGFDQLPRYPRTDPLGARNDAGGVSQQSFKASGATPEQVVGWYRDHLDGWTVVDPPHPTGAADVEGVWEKGDRQLRVTAGPAPTVGPATTVQYSLILRPL